MPQNTFQQTKLYSFWIYTFQIGLAFFNLGR